MVPKPRAHTSPPKPWEHEQRGVSTAHKSSRTLTALGSNGGTVRCAPLQSAGGQSVTSGVYPPRLGISSASHPHQQLQQRGMARGSEGVVRKGGSGVPGEYGRRAFVGGATAGEATPRGGQGGDGSSAVAKEKPNGSPNKLETQEARAKEETVGGSGATAVPNGNSVAPTNQRQLFQQSQQQHGMQGAGAYGGMYGGYGSAGGSYGAGRFGGSTSYGGGYGGGYGGAYGGGGYGGYGGYGGNSSMYGSGYGMYGGGRYGTGGMGMGGMGMGAMGGFEQQFSWLHNIQQFTSSLGYLTEMLGMNTQAIGFIFGNLMGFFEQIGNTFASIQPWREFPPGHPRHGEPPPTLEEERRRLSRLRVLRFALTIVMAYAAFRLSRALHRLVAGRPGGSRAALTHASLENIYRQQRVRGGTLKGKHQSAEALAWDGSGSSVSSQSSRVAGGARAGRGGSVGGAFDDADPWNNL